MPGPRLKYTESIRAKGRVYWYFRQGRCRVRLPGAPGAAAFHARYAELLAAGQVERRVGAKAGTVGALIAAYQASPEWAALRPKTRATYQDALAKIAVIAAFPVAEVRRHHVVALRDRHAATPRTADMIVQMVRRLFQRAVAEEAITANPVTQIAGLARRRAGTAHSHRAWDEAACATMETAIAEGRAPAWAATAYMLARYTSQRRGDVLGLTRADVEAEAVAIGAQEKTGAGVWMPQHGRLRAYLATLPVTPGPLVQTPRGRRWNPSTFSSRFRHVLDGLGLEGLSLHGLRHTLARELAEAGASEEEIRAITGHADAASVAIYVRQARQHRMAARAMARLAPAGPAPTQSAKPSKRTAKPRSERNGQAIENTWSGRQDSNLRLPAPKA